MFLFDEVVRIDLYYNGLTRISELITDPSDLSNSSDEQHRSYPDTKLGQTSGGPTGQLGACYSGNREQQGMGNDKMLVCEDVYTDDGDEDEGNWMSLLYLDRNAPGTQELIRLYQEAAMEENKVRVSKWVRSIHV